jgi:hypothetical protein
VKLLLLAARDPDLRLVLPRLAFVAGGERKGRGGGEGQLAVHDSSFRRS